MPSSEAAFAVRNLLGRLAPVVGAMLLILPVQAADKDAKDPSRRLQQQLRKAEQDKAQLLQQKTAAEALLKETQDKAAEAERQGRQRNARLTREIETLKAQLESLTARLESQTASNKAELTALGSKLADTERALIESRRERLQLDTAFARQRTVLSTCAERNLAMHRLGNEVLDKYEEKGCLASVLQAEPFTQLQRAKIENLIEDYRDKLDGQKFEATVLPGARTGSSR